MAYKILKLRSKQHYLRMIIDMNKKDIEDMEKKIKDLDFAEYLRTGKFPE